MPILYLFFGLIVGIIGSGIIQAFFPKIPVAFIQIIFGLVLSTIPMFASVEIEPEIFLLVVIAPLMFNEGQNTSVRKIIQNFNAIGSLSVWLVLLTVFVLGFVMNSFNDEWTLPLALLLASIVTPTDAVANKSITENLELQEGVDDALEYESLFNDATGLVLFTLSLTVLQTHKFSLIESIESFFMVSLGGMVVGLVLAWVIIRMRVWFNKHSKNPITIIIPLSVLTPVVTYWVAEELHVSGILAVVIAGVVHNLSQNRLRMTSTSTTLVMGSFWDVIEGVLNGFVFLMLGISFPHVWNNVKDIGTENLIEVVTVSVAIYLIILIVRYLWAYTQKSLDTFLTPIQTSKKERIKESWIFALGGVHGAFTLALALSIPLLLENQSFPFRNELIMNASIVIVLSMIIPTIVFPFILPATADDFTKEEFMKHRNMMISYALKQADNQFSNGRIKDSVMFELRLQRGLEFGYEISDDDVADVVQQAMIVQDDWLNSPEVIATYPKWIIDSTRKRIQFKIPRNRVSFKHRIQIILHVWAHNWHVFRVSRKIHRTRKRLDRGIDPHTLIPENSNKKDKLTEQTKDLVAYSKDNRKQVNQKFMALENETFKVVMNWAVQRQQEMIKENKSPLPYEYIEQVYENRHKMYKRQRDNDVNITSDDIIKAYQLEYNYVQNAFSSQAISESLANRLYDEINQSQILSLRRIDS